MYVRSGLCHCEGNGLLWIYSRVIVGLYTHVFLFQRRKDIFKDLFKNHFSSRLNYLDYLNCYKIVCIISGYFLEESWTVEDYYYYKKVQGVEFRVERVNRLSDVFK